MCLKRLHLYLVTLFILNSIGCGGNQTVMPSGPLTDEQKAAYAAEMSSVEDQESQGNIDKIGKKSRK